MREALAMMEEVQDSRHPAVGNILISLGEFFINIDDKTQESILILTRAVEIFRPLKSYRRNVRKNYKENFGLKQVPESLQRNMHVCTQLGEGYLTK